MLLISMMSFIKNQEVNLFHLDVAMHQQIVKLPRDENENIIIPELLDPILVFVHLLVIFASYIKISM